LPKLPDTTLLYKELIQRLGSSAGIRAIRSAQRWVLKSLLPHESQFVVEIDSSVDFRFSNAINGDFLYKNNSYYGEFQARDKLS
jgi:hypothetical protein